MIDIKTQTLHFGAKSYSIVRWDVWFMTPFGLITNLKDAIEKMISNELDPSLTILPVAVALSTEDSRYEVILPRG